MLYCLNWHIKDLCDEALNENLSAEEKSLFRERIKELRDLKEQVLAKLVIEGKAVIRGIQVDIKVSPRKYYCIRLNRVFSFHSPMKEFKELLSKYEKTGSNQSADTP